MRHWFSKQYVCPRVESENFSQCDYSQQQKKNVSCHIQLPVMDSKIDVKYAKIGRISNSTSYASTLADSKFL